MWHFVNHHLSFVIGKILAEVECCICYSKKWFKSGYEKLTKLQTESAANTLQSQAIKKKDIARLLACVSGLDWKNIVAMELFYHHSCYKNYTRHDRNKESDSRSLDATAVERILDYVNDHVIKGFEVIPTGELMDVYIGGNLQIALPDKRTLIKLVTERFDGTVDCWTSKTTSFIYNDSIKKGQVIEVLLRKIHHLEKRLQPKTINEMILDVACLIRKEVSEMPDTFSQWPPVPDSLPEASTQLPPTLNSLLISCLSSRSVDRTADKKKLVVNSIGQDMIYNIANGSCPTSKHVKMALCMKRQTGSKEMVTWMNRLGHGISYDEVSSVETFLADESINHKDMKSYCPPSVQPSIFVTFVWDNNDINPDSLTGSVMHCTNGIIIQLRAVTTRQRDDTNHSVTSSRAKRKRSFIAKPNILPVYVSKKRESPAHLTNTVLPVEQVENSRRSSFIDFLWVLLHQKSKDVPMWTGFNYLIENDAQDEQ